MIIAFQSMASSNVKANAMKVAFHFVSDSLRLMAQRESTLERES